MKKLFLALLSCAFMLTSIFGAFTATSVLADDVVESDVSTEIFLPTTYLQYYRLDNPYAICREASDGKELVAISHKGAIVVYVDEKFYKIDISGLSSEQGVPSLQLYGDYLLFSARSTLYSIYVGDFPSNGDLTYSSVKCDGEIVGCNDFSVCGDDMAVLTNSDLAFYTVSVVGNSIALTAKTGGINRNNLSSVLLSKSGATYFYDKTARAIFSLGDGEPVRLTSVSEVNAIAESGEPSDNSIYYSCADGVFSVNPENGDSPVAIAEVSPIDDEDKDLGKIWKPQGICLTGRGLWVVDSEIGAVQEIDLTDNSFTDFAITTNSKAVNRLSSNASGITSDKDCVYALDENRVVVIENAYGDKESRSYRRVLLDCSADKFAVGDGYVAYSSGGTLFLGKIPNDAQAESTLESVSLERNTIDSDKIIDICYNDGVFFVLGNVLNNQKTYPIIYAVDLSAQTKTIERYYTDTHTEMKANRIAVDVFGSVYLSAYDSVNASYSFFVCSETGATELLSGYKPSGEIIKMQTDFDGKLYLLMDDGKITCLDANENGGYSVKFEKTVTKSSYLEDNGVGNPVAFTVNENSDKAYLLFGGLILASSNASQLGISTLNTIAIPHGFSFDYSPSVNYGRLVENSKLFKVDADKIQGDYFVYEECLTRGDDEDYAFIKISERFSLAVKRGVTAIVRNTDIESDSGIIAVEEERYALVEFKLYSLPVLEDLYLSDTVVQKRSTVSIVGNISFGGNDYSVIKSGEKYGFVPSSFLTDSFVETVGVNVADTAYVYSRDGVIVYDDDLTPTDEVIYDRLKILVVTRGDKYSLVEFADGSRGYVDNAFITSGSKNEFIKGLVVVLFAASFMVTCLFFERKFLFENRD